MGFLPFPAVTELHLNVSPGIVTENEENKTVDSKTKITNFWENSKFDRILTTSATVGGSLRAKLDILNVGLALETQTKYFKQNWNQENTSDVQTIWLTQLGYGVVLGIQPSQNWDASLHMMMTMPLFGTSKRTGGEEAGDYKITASRSYTARATINGLRNGGRTFGVGGEYTLGSLRMENKSNANKYHAWFYSGYSVLLESRWEFK